MMGDREPTGPQVGIPDTVDQMDPSAADPEPDEVIDHDDPSYVNAATAVQTAATISTPWDDQ